jgi:hypothetical protein
MLCGNWLFNGSLQIYLNRIVPRELNRYAPEYQLLDAGYADYPVRGRSLSIE